VLQYVVQSPHPALNVPRKAEHALVGADVGDCVDGADVGAVGDAVVGTLVGTAVGAADGWTVGACIVGADDGRAVVGSRVTHCT